MSVSLNRNQNPLMERRQIRNKYQDIKKHIMITHVRNTSILTDQLPLPDADSAVH